MNRKTAKTDRVHQCISRFAHLNWIKPAPTEKWTYVLEYQNQNLNWSADNQNEKILGERRNSCDEVHQEVTQNANGLIKA